MPSQSRRNLPALACLRWVAATWSASGRHPWLWQTQMGASLPWVSRCSSKWGLTMEAGSAQLLGHLSGPGPGPGDSSRPPSLPPVTVKKLRPPSWQVARLGFQVSWLQAPHSPTGTTAACHVAELAGPSGLSGPSDDGTWDRYTMMSAREVVGRRWKM